MIGGPGGLEKKVVVHKMSCGGKAMGKGKSKHPASGKTRGAPAKKTGRGDGLRISTLKGKIL